MDANANLQSAPAYDYIVAGADAGGAPLAGNLAVAGFQMNETAGPAECRPVSVLPGVGHNLQDRYKAVVVNQMTQDFGLLKDALLATQQGDSHFRQWRNQRTGMFIAAAIYMISEKASDVMLEDAELAFTQSGA